MLVPRGHTTETIEIKQSKFIAHLCPYGMFGDVLAKLKREHPKARHFVTAFRYLNEFDQVVEGSSDDGEPRGTSGKPTLAVLQGHEMINTGIITVRYFGGTKLGTGGLVRAYSDAANAVLGSSELLPYLKEESLHISCAYPNMGRVEYLIEQCGLTVREKEFNATEVQVTLSGAPENLERFLQESDRLVVRN
jgi:uncharacterized YigZ family protein